MNIIDNKSLYKTLDNLNQIFLRKEFISLSDRKNTARWISDRQGLKGSYTDMFAPTESDFNEIKLFTGDKLTSKASIAHILGEESLRALYLLNVQDRKIQDAFDKARSGIMKVLKRNYEAGIYPDGTFCCGKCTVALWRNLSAEGVRKNKKSLESGINYMKSFRDGKGKYNRFPFFYTVLALSDIDLPESKAEIEYCSSLLRKYVKRKEQNDIYSERKKIIAERALEMIS
ncbi:MAG TPA: hypothetical protein PKC91_03605 [Ignavibacteria bacterium]|nr:hypothetical protein [Ignavibacteria bacterium]